VLWAMQRKTIHNLRIRLGAGEHQPRRRQRVPMRYRSRDEFRYLESVRSRGFNWVAE